MAPRGRPTRLKPDRSKPPPPVADTTPAMDKPRCHLLVLAASATTPNNGNDSHLYLWERSGTDRKRGRLRPNGFERNGNRVSLSNWHRGESSSFQGRTAPEEEERTRTGKWATARSQGLCSGCCRANTQTTNIVRRPRLNIISCTKTQSILLTGGHRLFWHYYIKETGDKSKKNSKMQDVARSVKTKFSRRPEARENQRTSRDEAVGGIVGLKMLISKGN
ncbi:hypothetical protein Tco_1080094 [Tanacetum coccineum]|uniref:Uncharacterized protein n=1 Tax=Tanacetum coccineum TaxID=301880 RepID=A0ABQ5HUL2_9ASTR